MKTNAALSFDCLKFTFQYFSMLRSVISVKVLVGSFKNLKWMKKKKKILLHECNSSKLETELH